MSKGSWNARTGSFTGVKPATLSPSVEERGQPTSVGTPDTLASLETETMPQHSLVENQITHSNSVAFYRSIEDLRSLTSTISEQLDALSTIALEQAPASSGTLSGMRPELALMSLNLASLIYSASLSKVAQLGSAKPPSLNTSLTGSTHEGCGTSSTPCTI
jgi:hypothetical protein